jgi:hypothetical protein
VVASPRTLRQQSGSTPHDAITVDPRLSSHQSVSLALDRQRPHSRQAANLARPRTANVASQAHASPSVGVLAGKTIAQPASIKTHQASRRDQIPIVLAAPPLHHSPRFRALALFGRRPHQRVDSPIMPATENLHKSGHADGGKVRRPLRLPRTRETPGNSSLTMKPFVMVDYMLQAGKTLLASYQRRLAPVVPREDTP